MGHVASSLSEYYNPNWTVPLITGGLNVRVPGPAIQGGAARGAGGYGRNLLQDLFSIKQQKGLGDIPAGNRADAEALGGAWVNGRSASRFQLEGGGYGLTDGTRTFRLQFKPKDGVWKANFQENTFIPGRAKGIEVKNIHMTITDMVAP